MPYLHARGDIASRIWIILDHPYPSDIPRGYIFSGGLGFVFDNMLKEAGLSPSDVYVTCRRPDTDSPSSFASLESALAQFQPPLVCVLGEVANWFLPELRAKNQGTYKGELNKYVGSLLESPMLNYPHWMMPLYEPSALVQDWTERNVSTYIDLQKLRDELQYWRLTGKKQPLKERKLVYGDLEFDDLCNHLEGFKQSKLLSLDIETVYPRGKSAYIPHPGYPITIGLAPSSVFGISFNLFRSSPVENRLLWRILYGLFESVPLLGQNIFNFDLLFLQALGMEIPRGTIQDTLIRHHILWPELSHKLQFMTRQYTREPYYKDEGKAWSMKDMSKLRRYNCLDVCVTYEVWEQQELEFQQRKHLA
jgi:uracil-DNA glycosylase family 4